MILGHDFHSEVAFAKSLSCGGEIQVAPTDPTYRHVPTWVALLKVLADAGIAPERCFFTNVYMGLRKGKGTVGRFPGARDAAYVQQCQAYVHRQLLAQRPRLILTLGAWVPPFLAPLAAELRD
jgi:uracil-DNA glycosylase